MLNISGSEFRKCLEKKTYFKYADKKVQNFMKMNMLCMIDFVELDTMLVNIALCIIV